VLVLLAEEKVPQPGLGDPDQRVKSAAKYFPFLFCQQCPCLLVIGSFPLGRIVVVGMVRISASKL
jgi:hypothetical protein